MPSLFGVSFFRSSIELEVCLDAVPLVVCEHFVFAIVHPAVVAAFEFALSQAVRFVLILDILRGQAQLAVPGLDVNGQMRRRGTREFAVFRGQEMHQVRMIRAPGPFPAFGEPHMEANVDRLRGFEQTADGRALRLRRAILPGVFDASPARLRVPF